MEYIPKEMLDILRAEHPTGCRVKLVKMDDCQAPPKGTEGTVLGVDDIGSIKVAWDSGGHLSVVYGEDRCIRLDPVHPRVPSLAP
ncbi:MAG: DUF4314 domain-containing protein [Eubacteriales bacterium]